jgi:hypothetical protein
VARTAVIAGTATSVSNRVSRRQGNRWAAKEQQQYEQQAPPQQAYAPPPPPPPPPADPVARLKDLAALRDQGVLTEAEFQAQKEKILAA